MVDKQLDASKGVKNNDAKVTINLWLKFVEQNLYYFRSFQSLRLQQVNPIPT